MQTRTRAETSARARRPLRVLLIDDGATSSATFQQLSLGVPDGTYVVERVSVHKDALDALENDNHDVYVLSHLVGTRTGFDLLSWVKARGAQLPIVFVSGAADHRTGVTAVSAGASCYVVEDAIDSGLLEHSLSHAVEQTRALVRLRDAGIVVEGDTSTTNRLLFRISERLRAPTAAVLAATRRSLDSALPAHALESFGLIEDKANVLLTIANDLNDLALLEAGHLRFSTEEFSLRGLVSHMSQAVGSVSTPQDSRVSANISPDVPDAVVGDPGRLRLIIMSFVEAVIARSSTDRAVVKVRVDQKNPGGVMLRFTIEADRGVNDNLGDTRQRHHPTEVVVDPSTTFDTGSLGMPVAHETVSRMGGSVTVRHTQTRGVSIDFTIRLQVSDAVREHRLNLDHDARPQDPILVIAADDDARQSIIQSLNGTDLPLLASSSVGAWTAGRLTTADGGDMPSLVVIESAGDSFAVCDEFNAVVSGAVPVVIVVGSGKRGDAARCRERDVRAYLSRPLNSGDLSEAVLSSLALTAAGDTTTLVTRHWLRDGRQSLHVLVVDDSSTNRFLLTRMLEQRGHTTAIACDGTEAVGAHRRDSFNVILMDVAMPVMDGLDSTRIIREETDPSANRPLIIGVSAFHDEDSIIRAENAGMDGFLAKPVRPDVLFAAIERHVPAVLTRAE